jgi:hypothetical protein
MKKYNYWEGLKKHPDLPFATIFTVLGFLAGAKHRENVT